MLAKLITLIMKEQTRHEVINDNLKGRVKVKEAGRQIHRLRERVKKEGIKGIVHKLRGRPSSKKIPQYIRRGN